MAYVVSTLTVEQYRGLVKKRHKYGRADKSARTVDNPASMWHGVTFDSKREMIIGLELELLKHAGVVSRIDRQVRWPLIVDKSLVCTYVCDFRVVYSSGLTEVVEVKGFETPEWKLKHKLFSACWPKVLLRVVK